MLVRIKRDYCGTAGVFRAGSTIDMPEDEAKSWLKNELGELPDDVETAAIESAPEKATLPRGRARAASVKVSGGE